MDLGSIAQKIVDATMEVIDNRNVNIMDINGVIIASGEKGRVNTYHKGADDVIKYGKTIEIFPQQVENYKGAKEGVNMPICIGNKVIGVVGVYGHPDEVRIVAKLVKISVELNLEQYVISEEIKTIKDLKIQLLRKLIYENSEKNQEELLCLSKVINIDLFKDRYAVVMEIQNIDSKETVKLLKKMNEIENFLDNNRLIDKDDFYGNINEYFVIFRRKQLQSDNIEFMAQIKKRLSNNFDLDVKIVCSSFYEGLGGYRKSYEEAVHLLNINNSSFIDINLISIKSEYILSKIDDSVLEHNLEDIYKKILDEDGNVEAWIYDTLKSLFNNNLNINETAKEMFIHRNTLTYRIKKIEGITGLSINKDFNNDLLLRLLLVFIQRKKRCKPFND